MVPSINPGRGEYGGRTIPQKGGNRCKLSMISDCTVCPSDSRFRSITKDLGRLREMPSFALSRRQRGFESRWGYKLKHPARAVLGNLRKLAKLGRGHTLGAHQRRPSATGCGSAACLKRASSRSTAESEPSSNSPP